VARLIKFDSDEMVFYLVRIDKSLCRDVVNEWANLQ
jgi:hypothetical protein